MQVSGYTHFCCDVFITKLIVWLSDTGSCIGTTAVERDLWRQADLMAVEDGLYCVELDVF